MITPLLEKAIAKGDAYYQKWTHGLGMFGGLTIPKDSTVIIVDVKWNYFINPYKNDGNITVREFLKYNEYTLKIDGKKSTNYMFYRGGVDLSFSNFAVSKENDTMISFDNFYVWNIAKPLIQDVFFICQEFVKVTIFRNVYIHSMVSNYGTLNKAAGDPDTPLGVQNVNVLRRLEMNSFTPRKMYNTPPNYENAGLGAVAVGLDNFQSYQQDVDPVLSQIYAPDTGFTATIGRPYVTQPLVEFGIVVINTTKFDRLMNS